MPSATDQHEQDLYLPPLDQCFNGEARVISWKTIFQALKIPSFASQCKILRPYLSSDQAEHALTSPSTRPSEATKSEFETLTSAINLTPTDNGKYDIKQIKDDTLWLSKQAKIDEVSALRLVVIAWQERPITRLCHGYSEGEVISLQQVGSVVGNLRASIAPQKSRNNGTSSYGHADPPQDFNNDDKRHARLLSVYSEERSYLVAVNVALQARYCLEPELVLNFSEDPLLWASEIGKDVAETRSRRQSGSFDASDGDEPLQPIISTLRKRLENVESGSGWDLAAEGEFAFLEEHYRASQIADIIRLLRLALIHVNQTASSITPESVKSWFRFMQEYDFFQFLQAPTPSQHHHVETIQALASLISYQILDLARIVHTFSSQQNTNGHSARLYIHDSSCETQINDALIIASTNQIAVAGPAIMAWGLILRAIFESEQRLALPENEAHAREEPPGILIGDEGLNLLAEFLGNDGRTVPEERINLALRFIEVGVEELQCFSAITGILPKIRHGIDPIIDSQLELNARKKFLSLVGYLSDFFDYGPEILDMTLMILDPESQISKPKHTENFNMNQLLADQFLADSYLPTCLLGVAFSRFPHEIEPVLRLCHALSASTDLNEDDVPRIAQMVMSTPRFTQKLPYHFNDYELLDEDQNISRIRLLRDLPIIAVTRAGSQARYWSSSNAQSLVKTSHDPSSHVPAGTTGYIISESRPFIVAWDHETSPLRHITALLSTALSGNATVDPALSGPPGKMVQAAIVDLISRLVWSTHRYEESGSLLGESSFTVHQLLQEANANLRKDQDIFGVVSEIFEEELSASVKVMDQSTVDLLSSCMRFFESLLPIAPSRVWALLARSELLEYDGRGGRIGTVVTSVEMITGKYDFLLTCARFFGKLHQDAIENMISRKVPGKPITHRFDQSHIPNVAASGKAITKVMNAFTRTFLEVLRSSQDWKFMAKEQQFALNEHILRVFDRLVCLVYMYDDARAATEKLTSSLYPAAKLVVDSYLAPKGNLVQLSPLLQSGLFDANTNFNDFGLSGNEEDIGLRKVALGFSSTLLDISILQDLPPTSLQERLLHTIPVLARLHAREVSLRESTTDLLSKLIQTVSKNTAEPPSIVANLNTQNALDFVSILSHLDKPLYHTGQERSIWRFFTSVIENRQQWLAAYLLTGNNPRGTFGKDGKGRSLQTPEKSVLTIGLDSLASVRALETPISRCILRFLVQVQNHYAWASNTVRKHPNFLDKISYHMKDVSDRQKGTNPEELTSLANAIYGRSLLSEFFAIYIHNIRQTADASFIKKLLPKLGYFQSSGVEDPQYSRSLHSRLRSNFEAKLPGCSVENFKRLTGPIEYGTGYCFDIDLADEMLWSYSWWRRHNGEGFVKDFMKANLNLSLVEAQLRSVVCWKALAVELSRDMTEDEDLQEKFANLVRQCLTANSESSLPDEIFQEMSTTRTGLALTIIRRLVDMKSKVPLMKSLLLDAWRAVLRSDQDFENAFVGSSASYYRSLLQVLYCSLQPHVYISSKIGAPPNADRLSVNSALPEICTEVVARGFRALASQLHESADSVQPADFSLICSIFQSILRIPSQFDVYSTISLRLSESGVSRYALALFSWSDKITTGPPDNDPIYGELSISFLLEMSTLPPLAEFLATEGVLSQLNSMNIMEAFRRNSSTPGWGQFDPPARLYKIWARGVLPLVLNVLLSVGAPFALEAVTFLNNFAPQLEHSASYSLDAKAAPTASNPHAGSVTLTAACEAHTLALLNAAIDGFRGDPAATAGTAVELPALKWHAAGLKEDLETWVGGSREALRERIMPTDEKEVELAETRTSESGGGSGGGGGVADGAANALEAMVLAELKGALTVLNSDVGS